MLFIPGLCMLMSCWSARLETFDPSFMKLITPFTHGDTAVFACNEKIDTIIFYPVTELKEKMRDIERGFYNAYYKRVDYELTSGSYHKFPVDSSWGTYRTRFLGLGNHSDRQTTGVELFFLGLIYDEEGVRNALKHSPVFLSDTTALYKEVNINECVQSFKLDPRKGILEFTDCEGCLWERK